MFVLQKEQTVYFYQLIIMESTVGTSEVFEINIGIDTCQKQQRKNFLTVILSNLHNIAFASCFPLI